MIKLSELWAALEPLVVKTVHRTEARGARVISTATQTLANATQTPLSFDTAEADTEGCWTNSSPTRLTIQREGFYSIGGGYVMPAAQITASGRLSLGIRKNGSVFIGWGDLHAQSGQDSVVDATTGMAWLAVGDYVEFVAYQNLGATKTVSGSSATVPINCYAWLQRAS